MNPRVLAIAAFCVTCIATAVYVTWSYVDRAADIQPRAARLDIPWVKTSSADGFAPDAQSSIEDLRVVAGDRRASQERRAQAIYLIAKAKDWDSVETLIAQLDDPSPLVRGRAAAAIRLILGTDFEYRAEDDQNKRTASIDGIRRYWQSRKSNPPVTE